MWDVPRAAASRYAPNSHPYSRSDPIPHPVPIPIPVPRAPGRFPRCRPPPGRPPPPPERGHPPPALRARLRSLRLSPCAFSLNFFYFPFPPPPPPIYSPFCFVLAFLPGWVCFVFLLVSILAFSPLPGRARHSRCPRRRRGAGRRQRSGAGLAAPSPTPGTAPPSRDAGRIGGRNLGPGGAGEALWRRGRQSKPNLPLPMRLPRFGGLPRCGGWGDSHPFAADPALDSAPTGPAGPPSPAAGTPKILFFPPQTHSPCSPSLAGGCCASFPPAVSNVLTTRFQGVFGAIFKACSQWLDLEIQA